MNSASPTVFVVDDEASVRNSLARLLRLAGFKVATFSSSLEFLDSCDPAAAGCVVLDIAMPDLTGLELQSKLRDRGVGLPIVFVTGRANVPITVQAMKDGAVDFLTKPVDFEALQNAIRKALEKDRHRLESHARLAGVRQRLASLTPRQHEVLLQVIRGKMNKEIAAELGTVERTVKVHRAEVMRKMQVQSVAELVRLTHQAGLV